MPETVNNQQNPVTDKLEGLRRQLSGAWLGTTRRAAENTAATEILNSNFIRNVQWANAEGRLLALVNEFPGLRTVLQSSEKWNGVQAILVDSIERKGYAESVRAIERDARSAVTIASQLLEPESGKNQKLDVYNAVGNLLQLISGAGVADYLVTSRDDLYAVSSALLRKAGYVGPQTAGIPGAESATRFIKAERRAIVESREKLFSESANNRLRSAHRILVAFGNDGTAHDVLSELPAGDFMIATLVRTSTEPADRLDIASMKAAAAQVIADIADFHTIDEGRLFYDTHAMRENRWVALREASAAFATETPVDERILRWTEAAGIVAQAEAKQRCQLAQALAVCANELYAVERTAEPTISQQAAVLE